MVSNNSSGKQWNPKCCTIPVVCTIYCCVQRVGAAYLIQLLNCYWTNEHSKSNTKLIKSENAGRLIYKHISKIFYLFVLKENDSLATENSNKK